MVVAAAVVVVVLLLVLLVLLTLVEEGAAAEDRVLLCESVVGLLEVVVCTSWGGTNDLEAEAGTNCCTLFWLATLGACVEN